MVVLGGAAVSYERDTPVGVGSRGLPGSSRLDTPSLWFVAAVFDNSRKRCPTREQKQEDVHAKTYARQQGSFHSDPCVSLK